MESITLFNGIEDSEALDENNFRIIYQYSSDKILSKTRMIKKIPFKIQSRILNCVCWLYENTKVKLILKSYYKNKAIKKEIRVLDSVFNCFDFIIPYKTESIKLIIFYS